MKSKKTELVSQSTIRTWVSREAVVKTGENANQLHQLRRA